MKKVDHAKVKKVEKHLSSLVGLEKFPQLAHFLSDALYEGGDKPEEREGGSIWLQARGGELQIVLKEPSQGLMMRIAVPSWAALAATLEASLGDAGSMWEVDAYASQRKFKKRK